eukprot:CAMPEP_0197026712 /NCGR_PEP_ID=MMETSP1384-20130603/6743_1 /TAXON_ID=29189 /ORGANISM="Ammonia sp." /LENGTH=408 /DNA_ID=CAMNT_0042455425 /DNA_START=26 /DNA_END=1252 /DNA_ORIENTATION=+
MAQLILKQIDDLLATMQQSLPSASHRSTEQKDAPSTHNANDYSTLPIIVTGGAGFIGSHTVVELIHAGFTNIIILDNFVNSSIESISRVKHITSAATPNIINYELDIAKDVQKLDEIVARHRPYACIHFAGLKAVGESIQKPLLYYQNNLVSTTNLIEVLGKYDCNNIIFSSSATVYGNNPNNKVPVTEASQVGVGLTNPYGKTKYFIEEILTDYGAACKSARIVILRYFNPIGAHKSGLIGEDPQGIPNNLMPFLSRVAVAQTKKESDKAFYERYKELSVFGNDYKTCDGTGVRDYIHVVDLAQGHVNALIFDVIKKGGGDGNVSVYNLGTGKGTSVLQLKDALEKACGFKIPFVIKERRAGDIAELYADCSLAEKAIQWKAKLTIDDACRDSWNWQSKNPYGFKKQ